MDFKRIHGCKLVDVVKFSEEGSCRKTQNQPLLKLKENSLYDST